MHMAMAPRKDLIMTVVLLASTYTLVVVGSLAEAAAPRSAAAAAAVYRFELIHVDANGNFTRDELIRRAQHRSHAGAAAASPSSPDPAAAAVTFAGGDDGGQTYKETASFKQSEYLLELSVGKSAKTFLAVADTGSDVSWTLTRKRELCDPDKCQSDRSHPQQQCRPFSKTYGSGAKQMQVKGFTVVEGLTLSPCRFRILPGCREKQVSIPLGCAVSCGSPGKDDDDDCKIIPKGADGLVGLDLSPKSFLSYLRQQAEITKFSYCLSSRLHPRLKSRLWFGGAKLGLASAVPPVPDPGVQTAPLVSTGAAAGSVRANKYYVELVAISINVDGGGGLLRKVELPGELFNHRSVVGDDKFYGVMFVDSGCSFSKLETPAFNEVKNLLEEGLGRIKSFLHVDEEQQSWTCFHKPKPKPYTTTNGDPDVVLTLHLGPRGDAKMPLPWSSYMMPVNRNMGDGKMEELSCLAVKDAGRQISILGNFQQQNILMLYDLHPDKTKNELKFAPVEDCSKQKLG